MPLCYLCLQVTQKEHPTIRVAGREPTVDHFDKFSSLQRSARTCELCRVLLDASLRKHCPSQGDSRGDSQGDDSPEPKFEGLKLRVEVDHYNSNPYQSYPVSANDVASWGLRAYWECERPIWSATERGGGVEDVVPTMERWIRECDETHGELCCPDETGAGEPMLPTRCIEVGAIDGPVEPRLVITEGRSGRYTTLSHCWGKGVPARTTRASIDAMATAICLDELPKTYRDAIAITRGMGVRYLWIDSLCIIQDDRSDWEHESANMASIYGNAHFNIAATSSPDSSGGCLFPRTPTTALEIPPIRRYVPNQPTLQASPPSQTGQRRSIPTGLLHITPPQPSQPPQTARIRPALSPATLSTAPLNTRAWVLQEVVLSRRTIHFAQDQMYWFCASRRASEDGTLAHSSPLFGAAAAGSTPVLGPPHWPTGQTAEVDRGFAYTMWWALVEDYSARALSEKGDRSAALAGLTRMFQSRVRDCPVAGMWRAEMLDSLCWSVCDEKSERAEGPSWSWLSVDGAVRRNCCRLPRELPRQRTERDLEILSVDVEREGKKMTSQLKAGRIVAMGRLVELEFVVEEPHGCGKEHARQMELLQGGRRVGRFRFDRLTEEARGRVKCLAVTFKQVTLNFCPPLDAVYFWFHVLVLESTEKGDEFRRVGVGKVWENSGVFDPVEPRHVEIV